MNILILDRCNELLILLFYPNNTLNIVKLILYIESFYYKNLTKLIPLEIKYVRILINREIKCIKILKLGDSNTLRCICEFEPYIN